MALSDKKLRDNLRADYVNKVIESFEQIGDDIFRVKSNEIAIPVIDEERNERYVVITIKVPTGSRDDSEGYDGEAEAESYALKCAEKERKAKEMAEKKAKKIERDKALRKKKKEE